MQALLMFMSKKYTASRELTGSILSVFLYAPIYIFR